jgi:hypothetical protein
MKAWVKFYGWPIWNRHKSEMVLACRESQGGINFPRHFYENNNTNENALLSSHDDAWYCS